MTNNDILRRLRYTFDFSDTKMIGLFKHESHTVTRVQLSHWLKKDDDPEYVRLPDREMAIFLNGLIADKRGPQEGPAPEPERKVNNNIIFRKLKIALNLTAEDMLDIMALANFRVSKHELSAFFRKAGHKNYRECQDQVLRNFLTGLQYRERGGSADQDDKTAKKPAEQRARAVAKPTAEKLVKKPSTNKPAATTQKAKSTPTESGFKWGKAPTKGNKKSY